jgi:hypothetical protein
MLNYRYRACQMGIKGQVVEMAINGSGVSDTGVKNQPKYDMVISNVKKKPK